MPQPTTVTRSRLPFIAIGAWAAILAAIVAVGLVFGGRGATPDSTLGAAGAPGAAAINLNAPLTADPSASAAPSDGASTAPGASAAPGKNNDGTREGPRGFMFGRGGPGFGGGGDHGPGRGAISIATISGSSLSLKTDDGWTRTIDATGATITEHGGATLAVGDLKAGDHIVFRETRNADGTYTINAITRIPARTGGTVKTVSGTSATVTQPDGSTTTIGLTGSTTYRLRGKAATTADLKVGTRVRAIGSQDSSGNFTATTVDILPASVGGAVTARTANTITVKDRSGVTVTINVSGSTTYQTRGAAAATLADVAVGNQVVAEGTLNSDGSLDATVVHVGTGKPDGFGKPNRGPGHGAKPGSNASPAPTANAG